MIIRFHESDFFDAMELALLDFSRFSSEALAWVLEPIDFLLVWLLIVENEVSRLVGELENDIYMESECVSLWEEEKVG